MRYAAGARQVSRNTLTNLVVLAVNSLVTIWFTPYLIRHLGVAVYSLVPLALSLSTYMSILTVGLQSALGRYLTIEVAGDDAPGAGRVYSTAVFANFGLALGSAPALLAVAYFAPRVFNMPSGLAGSGAAFFGLALFSYVVVALREVVGITMFSTNRMDLQNASRLTEIVVRTVWVVVAFSTGGPDVYQVGAGMLAGATASLVVATFAWRIVVPEIRLRPELFDVSRLRDMVRTGGWITLTHCGALLHMATDLVVLNLLLGPETAGRYGSVLQFSIFIRSFAGSLAGVLAPVLIAQYAQGRYGSLQDTARHGVKVIGLAIGLPVALVSGFARPLLALWLGPEFVDLAPLLVVILVHLTWNYASLPLESVQVAYDRVKVPAIINVATGILNVGLSVVLAPYGPWGMGVALATVIALTLRSFVAWPLYASRLTGTPPVRYYSAILPPVAASVLVGALAYYVNLHVDVATWWALGAGTAVAGLAYAGIASLTLDSADRALFRSLIPRR